METETMLIIGIIVLMGIMLNLIVTMRYHDKTKAEIEGVYMAIRGINERVDAIADMVIINEDEINDKIRRGFFDFNTPDVPINQAVIHLFRHLKLRPVIQQASEKDKIVGLVSEEDIAAARPEAPIRRKK